MSTDKVTLLHVTVNVIGFNSDISLYMWQEVMWVSIVVCGVNTRSSASAEDTVVSVISPLYIFQNI